MKNQKYKSNANLKMKQQNAKIKGWDRLSEYGKVMGKVMGILFRLYRG